MLQNLKNTGKQSVTLKTNYQDQNQDEFPSMLCEFWFLETTNAVVKFFKEFQGESI